MTRRWFAVLVGAAAAVTGACGKTTDLAPSDVVVQFYVTLEVSGVRALPEPRALMALQPYVVPTLYAALERARQVRDSAAAAAPDEKPPFADGNLFSSLFEGHSTYVVRKGPATGDTTLVPVAFSNTDQKPAVSWTDTAVVVNTAPRGAAPIWRIADLRYGSTWEFGYRGTLSGVLAQTP